MNFVAISYAIAGSAYLVLSLVFLSGWRGRPLATRLIAATFATAIWAAVDTIFASSERVPFLLVFVVEVARDAAWLLLLTAMARGFLPRVYAISVHVLCGAALIAGVLLPAFGPSVVVTYGAALLSRSGLLLSFAALVLLEQIYRNATGGSQRALRNFVLGVGVLFAYDFFLYAQAELLKGIDQDAWAVRGIVCALAAPLIAFAVRRNPDWALDIFVSRQVVFYTTAFLAAGSYLLLMAIGGYYVRAMGGTWGGIAQIMFVAGAALVLAVMLFSTAMRRRLMVFISKHFFRNKYDYRIEWLRFIQTLSVRGDTDIRRTSLRAIAQIFASPGGILYTLDESGQRFLPVANWALDESKLHESCAATEIDGADELAFFLRDRQWVVDLVEYAQAPDRYQNIVLPECLQPPSKLRIVSPLLELDRLVGFVVLLSPPVPFDLTYEDRDLLKTVGRHVATYLAQHEANKKLAESQQFEAYSRLTAFMMHDLKNAAAQLSLIVANAERHKHNPEFIDDAIGTIGNATGRITRLIEQLQRGTSIQAGRRTDLCAVVRRAVSRLQVRAPVPQSNVPDQRINVIADPERLGMVVEHVIRNAQDATPADGDITVSMERNGDRVSICVSDNGPGMTPEFIRDRLFRPFDSTKGSKGMGIGAYQVREYVRSLGGDVSVFSTVAVGTRFTIQLPIVADSPSADTAQDSETHSQVTSAPTRHATTLTPDIVATTTHHTAEQ